ncbi:hypothetical protein BS47DRAFT_1375810 [Hydnum rufescens UP504]|uniref:Carboxypeptidase n=1 Tax=Hydnum rufescens UP504 TaxID=1448309 RepID=A0A9P6B3J5_9AGAM|nr:hypothetical protein BS47DRAFT_1375810 [Hydnum rufescens UP504]
MFGRLVSAFAAASFAGGYSQVQLGHERVNFPLGKLAAPISASNAADSNFTSFEHPSFPAHTLRIKRTVDFCDPTVKAYSGYIDADYGTKHLFFYFFESRGDPDKDDVLMWINGGPGCSSSLGLFMELGPCSVLHPPSGNGTKWNPYSWNANANLFFLDQPVGVGFSYADFGRTIETTEDAAKDVAAFVSIFFETFSQFKGRPFHMAGESYGGRYLPVFASEIIDQNAVAIAEGRQPIPLRSILIGNGFTDMSTMQLSYYDMQCTNVSVPPVLSIATCVAMKATLPRCAQALKEECNDRFDAIGCSAALDFCSTQLDEPYFSSGYPLIKYISEYLDKPEVRRTLGVDQSIGNFTSCNNVVGAAFGRRLDSAHRTHHYVAQLLERGLRVLIYVGEIVSTSHICVLPLGLCASYALWVQGTYDWICNHVGNYRLYSSMEWTGLGEFNKNELREWIVEGQVAGNTKSARGLTWATVTGAGHMVPYDKPVVALAMLQRWLAEEAL